MMIDAETDDLADALEHAAQREQQPRVAATLRRNCAMTARQRSG